MSLDYRVHVMAGDGNPEEDEPTYVENIRYACKLLSKVTCA